MRRLMENDRTLDEVRVSPPNFVPGGAPHIFPRGAVGWRIAGEVIGNNTSLSTLELCGVRGGWTDEVGTSSESIEKLRAFFEGAKRNDSIDRLSFYGWDALGGAAFPLAAPLLENRSVKMLNVDGCILGADGVRLLASALAGSNHKLEYLAVVNCSVRDEESFEELVAALDHIGDVSHQSGRRGHSLDTLDLDGNEIGRKGCAALAKMLQNPRCRLVELRLKNNCVDDEGVASLAVGLTKNDKLAWLDIVKGNSITDRGWAALLRILCNTDTIEHTFLSNHRLNYLGQGRRRTTRERSRLPDDLAYHLGLNGKNPSDPWGGERPFAPIQKILDNHRDWDISRYIEEELQWLPHILRWIDGAVVANANFDGNAASARKKNRSTLRGRRNSTIHQFVLAMPLIVVERLTRAPQRN